MKVKQINNILTFSVEFENNILYRGFRVKFAPIFENKW